MRFVRKVRSDDGHDDDLCARTLDLIRHSLVTIACMLALGHVTPCSGSDATLGLAFANAGWPPAAAPPPG